MQQTTMIHAGRWAVLVLVTILCAAFVSLAAAPVRADDGPQVKVMSRNLYLGADLLPVVEAPDIPTLMERAATVVRTVRATDFPTRARALAAEIDAEDPWLIGLQEVSLWRRGAMGILDGPTTQAETVVYDFLDLLMQRLAARGLDYTVVIKQSNFDAEVPTALGYDIRLTQRNVILARTDPPARKLQLSNARRGQYTVNSSFPTSFGTLTDTRGWLSVDAKVAGSSFRFVDTHLDSYVPQVRQAQIAELLAGPASTGKPVVLVGDLNAQPRSNVIGQVRAAGLKDAWAVAGKGPGYTCCQAEKLKNKRSILDRRIDYVFAEPALQVRKARLVGHQVSDRIGGLWPSDHAGVVSTLLP
jgi:endonuclease/exonuclease/phosphatase family metal-dependent hydrolase